MNEINLHQSGCRCGAIGSVHTAQCLLTLPRMEAGGFMTRPEEVATPQAEAHGQSRRLFLKSALAGGAAITLAGLPLESRADMFTPSVADQKKVGQQAAQQVLQKYREVSDARARHFDAIGARLVDALPAKDRSTWNYEFHVLDNKAINAFALPGGPMFMFTGLMDRVHSDDELAAVTGHEMTHVRKQHWAKAAGKQQQRELFAGAILGVTRAGKIWQMAAGAWDTITGLRYSRGEEDEADAGGLQNMVAAGYDPHGMLDLFQILQSASGGRGEPPAFLSDHPLTRDRIKKTQDRINHLSR